MGVATVRLGLYITVSAVDVARHFESLTVTVLTEWMLSVTESWNLCYCVNSGCY